MNTAGVVGRWDAALYDRYRAAEAHARPWTADESAQSRGLLSELARINEPLVIYLVQQNWRRPLDDFGPIVPGWKVAGSERLTWAEAMCAGHLAFAGAMSRAPWFDPTKGKLSGFLNKRVIDELQRAVQESAVVMRGRRRSRYGLARVLFLEDETELAGGLEAESSFEMRDPVFRPVLPMELRRAMAIFLEDHCRFATSARAAASAVRGRYQSVVIARGEAMPRGALTLALVHCGVRNMAVRVPWSEFPVEGFAGVSLQNVRP